MPQCKKCEDGNVELCRTINGRVRHFYGKTKREAQAKLDAAIIEASAAGRRATHLMRLPRLFGAIKSRKSSTAPDGATGTRWRLPSAGLATRGCA